MHQLLFIIFLTATSFCLAENLVFTNNFDSGNAGDFLKKVQNGIKLSNIPDGGKCLELAENVKWAELKPIAVQPEKKYKLSFRGRIEGENTVEKNERIHIMELQNPYRYGSSYQILFFDNANKKISVPQYSVSGFVITGKWHDYVNVFYTPPGAKTLMIRFLPKNHAMLIDNVSLSTEIEVEVINSNPDFRYGELNYCGWRPAVPGRLYQRPDSKTVIKSGYAGRSPRIPLRDDSAYRIYARGERQTPKGWMTLMFYDKDNKYLGKRFLLRPTTKGDSVDLVPPPNTRQGEVTLYSIILEELKITRIGDKSKIEVK